MSRPTGCRIGRFHGIIFATMELSRDRIHEHNLTLLPSHRRRWDAFQRELAERGLVGESILESLRGFQCLVTVPDLFGSKVAAGGGPGPAPGECIERAALLHRLTRQLAHLEPLPEWEMAGDWDELTALAIQNKIRWTRGIPAEPSWQEPNATHGGPQGDLARSLFAHLANAASLMEGEREPAPRRLPPLEILSNHDPLEACLLRIEMLVLCFLKAKMVDQHKLEAAAHAKDPLLVERIMHDAWQTDVRPLAAEYRLRTGAALHPFAAYRALQIHPPNPPLTVPPPPAESRRSTP